MQEHFPQVYQGALGYPSYSYASAESAGRFDIGENSERVSASGA
jgi:hypothetical protein